MTGVQANFEGFETIFKRFLGNFGCFSSIFAWYRMPLCRATGQGSPGAAPRRLNVGNMLDVDRYPKCCFNMFNIFGEPYGRVRLSDVGAHGRGSDLRVLSRGSIPRY